MRLRKKTIKGWMNKKRSKRLNGMNPENQNPVAAALVVGQQNHTASELRAAELCMEKEESLQNSLKRSGRDLQAVTQEVHQTGQALTWVKSYVLSKSLQLHKQDTLSENYT